MHLSCLWLQADNGYPGTKGYALTECLCDLLGLAARHLCIGGRLVYFLPAVPGACEGRNVPEHPALRLIDNCEQASLLTSAAVKVTTVYLASWKATALSQSEFLSGLNISEPHPLKKS